MDLAIDDRKAMYVELDALIGQRTGWVLFYRSRYGQGWARRSQAGIGLWYQSYFGDATFELLTSDLGNCVL